MISKEEKKVLLMSDLKDKISQEVARLVNILNQLDEIEFNKFFIERVHETVKISNPLCYKE